MIIAPYNTDAPIYHLPIATVSIIIVNVVVFFATTLQWLLGNVEAESIEWLMLEFDTINPMQWITGAFMHADPFHLIGNMVFLWSFGLVVEGKIGALRFTSIYLLIAFIDGALVQIPMFLIGSEERALGASGVIFALMMIACIWAPENEMDCFYWFFIVLVGTFEITIVKLAGIFVFMQLVFLWLGGFGMSSEMLHMIGVVIGAPIGFFMLRQDMVDCEGWDLVSRNDFLRDNDLFCTDEQRQRMKKKEQSIEDPVTAALGYTQPLPTKRSAPQPYASRSGQDDESLPEPKKKSPKSKSPLAKLQNIFEPERVKQQRREKESQSAAGTPKHPDFNRLAFAFRQSVESQSTVIATQTFLRMEQMKIAVGLGDQMLLRYVTLLGREKKWLEAMRPLAIVASHQGELADDARLRMAQIQLKVMGRPLQAIQTLSEIPDRGGDPSEANRKRMQAKAQLVAAAKQATGQ